MSRLVLGIFVVSTILITIYGQTPSTDDEYDYHYTLAWIGFDWNLFKELAVEKKNFVFSPACLKIVIALLYHSSYIYTQYEFQNAFQLHGKETVSNQYRDILEKLVSASRDHQVHVGSRIFLHPNLVAEETFSKTAKDVFQTDVESTDFSKNDSKTIINDWVEKLTKGRMRQLIDTEDIDDMMLLIANIAYLKGTWRYQFPKNRISLGKFNLIRDQDVVLLFRTVTVTYMTIEESFYYYEDFQLKVKIVRLPYKGGQYSMFIVLPTSNESVQTVLEKIKDTDVKVLLYKLEKKRVRVTLPKFKISSKKRLAETLQKFGLYKTFVTSEIPIPLAFAANHSFIQISDMIQKVGVEVDETGEKEPVGNKSEEVEAVFEATRPFLFFVQDSPGNIILVGKVENPVEQGLV